MCARASNAGLDRYAKQDYKGALEQFEYAEPRCPGVEIRIVDGCPADAQHFDDVAPLSVVRKVCRTAPLLKPSVARTIESGSVGVMP